jgi:hypothetical protein
VPTSFAIEPAAFGRFYRLNGVHALRIVLWVPGVIDRNVILYEYVSSQVYRLKGGEDCNVWKGRDTYMNCRTAFTADSEVPVKDTEMAMTGWVISRRDLWERGGCTVHGLAGNHEMNAPAR